MIGKSSSVIGRIASLVQQDVGKRGIQQIFPENNPYCFQQAAQKILQAQTIGILTGFPCFTEEQPHYENDGITGALAMAKTFINMNKTTKILLDKHSEVYMTKVCEDFFKDISPSIREKVQMHFIEVDEMSGESKKVLEEMKQFDALISIERVAAGREGQYMTMRAVNISHLAAKFDQVLFPSVGHSKANPGQTLISIGDGGNEVGMGSVQEKVVQFIPNGEKIAANSCCDCLLVTDTSNYGAYALIASVLTELVGLYKGDREAFRSNLVLPLQIQFDNLEKLSDVVQTLQTHLGVWVIHEKSCMDILMKYGIKDGIKKEVSDSCDGIPFETQAEVIKALQEEVLSVISD